MSKMKNNIVSIDAVISRIEINGYIDCTELGGYMEDYEYDNIIYYLKKYKDLQNRIDKAIEVIDTQMKLAEDGIKDNLRIIKFYLIKGECSVYDLTTEEDYKYKKMTDILKESGE